MEKAKHHLPPDLLADFEKQISKRDLSGFRSELLKIARPKLMLTCDGAVLKRMPKGMSRIGGPPDVSSLAQWKSPEDGKFSVFYLQVNMSEVPDPADFGLPEQGLLSIYVGNQNMVDDWDSRSSILFNARTDNLKRFPLPDLDEYCDDDLAKDHVPTCARPPRKLKARKAVWLPHNFAPDSICDGGSGVEDAYFDLCHHYEGTIDMCTPVSYSSRKGWTCLFRLHSCDYFSFGDWGKEYIWVRNSRGCLDFTKATADYDDY